MPDTPISTRPPRTRTPAQRTPAQKEASRRNGTRSRGPATPAGKAKSRYNAITHAQTAKTVTLKSEADQYFIHILAALEAEHQPTTETEINLVDNMALARWRCMRTWGQEKAILERAMDDVLRASPTPTMDPEDCGGQALRQLADNSKVLTWLDRMENRNHRIYHRSLRDLQRLREHRANMQQAGTEEVTAEAAQSVPAAQVPDIKSDKTNLTTASKQTAAASENLSNPGLSPELSGGLSKADLVNATLPELLRMYIPAEILEARLESWKKREALREATSPPPPVLADSQATGDDASPSHTQELPK